MKVVTTSYSNNTEILKFPDHYVGKAIMLSADGVTANEGGKKIVPAGTIIGNPTGNIYTISNDTNAEGVLLNDTDVTYGDAAATIIIHGFINTDKLPTAPDAAAITALKLVKFM